MPAFIETARSGARVFALATLAALLAATAGCGTQCDRDPNQPPIVFRGGTTYYAGTPAAFYESSGPGGPFLPFPPGRTYRFEEDLGGQPASVVADFAFDTYPIATSNDASLGGGAAPAAGNQFTVERQTKTSFDVRNDTCSDVKLRVTASNPVPAAPADASTRDY